jgi:hypothetical protein
VYGTVYFEDDFVELRFAVVISDAEKQNTMNVFLGVFRPEASRPAIWEKEYNSDYYLHHQVQSWGSVTFWYGSGFGSADPYL